jgi:hypothetical protein
MGTFRTGPDMLSEHEDLIHTDAFNVEVAIDPGANGGFAVSFQGELPYTYRMPRTEGDIHDRIKDITKASVMVGARYRYAYVEEVGGFVGVHQPGSAMFKFGRNYGFLLGALQSLGWHVQLIKPQAWQRALRLPYKRGNSNTEWKNKLKAEAQRRFPSLKVTLQTADALLLLDAARLIASHPNTKEKGKTDGKDT